MTLHGVLAAMPTPFTEDGQIDTATLERESVRLVDAGLDGIACTGSTGEFPGLSPDEHRLVIEVVAGAVKGRGFVVPGTGALTLAETVELTAFAAKQGADAALVIPPFYEAMPFRDVVSYYKDLASAVDLPIMLYHLPMAMGVEFTADQIQELGQIPNVASVKDSSGNGTLLAQLIHQEKAGGIKVFNGWDTLAFGAFASGATGAVWGAASVLPAECSQLFDLLVNQRDLAAARTLWDEQIFALCDYLMSHNYVATIKAAFDLLGNPVGLPRDPVRPLVDSEFDALRRTLALNG